MKFRNSVICLALLLAVSLPLMGGNSIFSFRGTPWQYYGNDIYGMTMGDVGMSDLYRKNMGFGNPAIVGNASKALFSTGMMFGWTGYKSEDVSGESFRDNSMDFPFFSIALPLNKHRLGFQFNSFASGVVENKREFDSVIYWGTVPMDTLTIKETQSIDRYIYRADLIYAYRFDKFSIGAAFNYYLGHDIRRFYQDSGNGIFNTFEKTDQSYKNPGATLGMAADLDKVSLGAYFSPETTLEGDLIRSSIHETEELGTYKYSTPATAGAGVTWKLTEELKVSSDFVYNFWSNAPHTEYVNDSWKFGMGIAMEPDTDSRKTFAGQMPKRIGFFHKVLPFESNGNPVSETAVSAGVTIPVKHNENRLDFGMQYLWRGNVEDHNLQDRSLMFMFGISGFDILSKPFTRTAPREIPQVEELSE